MGKRVQLLISAAALAGLLAGCGRAVDTYTNEKDATQTLELATDKGAPMREIAKGAFTAPMGEFVLQRGQQISTGRYSKVDNAYILFLDNTGSKKLKVEVQPDSSLRDDQGGIWKHQTHSRMLRSW